jgi:excisionase family DNA binding protein
MITAGGVTPDHVGGERSGRREGSALARPLLSPRQVAERVALSESTVRAAIARGELRASKLCRRIRIAESDVQAWISSTRVQPDERPCVPAPPRPRASGVLRALLDEGSS